MVSTTFLAVIYPNDNNKLADYSTDSQTNNYPRFVRMMRHETTTTTPTTHHATANSFITS